MSKKLLPEGEPSPVQVVIDSSGQLPGFAVILLAIAGRSDDMPPMIAGTCELELLESPRVAQAFNTLAEMLARTAHERLFPERGAVTGFVHIHSDRTIN